MTNSYLNNFVGIGQRMSNCFFRAEEKLLENNESINSDDLKELKKQALNMLSSLNRIMLHFQPVFDNQCVIFNPNVDETYDNLIGEIVDIYFERNVTKDGVIYEKKQASRFTCSEKKKAEKKEPVIVIDSSIHRESSNKRRKRLKKQKLKVPFKFNKKTKKKSKSSPQSSNLVFVGVDPGAKTLATAVSYGQFDSNVKRRNNTSDPDKSVVDLKDPAFKSNSRQFSYSSKQYYHDSKVNERNRVAKLWLDATVKVFKDEILI